MKKKYLSFYCIILSVICQALALSNPVFAGVNDFYFSEFSADYYLSRDTDGISKLEVAEELTAVFPNFNQNKGICRDIPFTNQDGANVTLPDLNRSNVKVFRNFAPEPIYSIEKDRGFYEVCTGTEEYVLGEQTYTFEYEFSKVVTDFSDHQELYWDTNGNGWDQEFKMVGVDVYVDEEILDDLTGEVWCYVGKYGESGQERCEVVKYDDGFYFSAENLKPGENLTFDIEFKPGTFVVPEPKKNYVFVFALVATSIICVVVLIYAIWKYLKNREKETYFKGFFVKPEYQPSTKYSLEELAELYMGKKKDMKVAVFLDLVVRKRIELISEGKKNWAFKVLDLTDTGKEERVLLAILNGGRYPKVGETVSIVARKPSVTLAELGRSFYSTIRQGLVSGGMVGDNYVMGETKTNTLLAALIVNLVFVWPFLAFMIFGTVFTFAEDIFTGYVMVLSNEFVFLLAAILFVTVLLWTFFNYKANRFKNITKRGIEAEKYMEGLELYIRMAEKDRLQFLQSVKGVDVSAKGVVRLYEKLLPYAAVFGLEKSWMEEMEKYCRIENVEEPDFLMTGILVSDISRTLNQTVDIVNSSTRMTYSGGGSSSGFSGGGGGGFSGGGGGGGGGGGR